MGEPGWHPDPLERYELRYHDGTDWTSHVSSGGTQSADPILKLPPEQLHLHVYPGRPAVFPTQEGVLRFTAKCSGKESEGGDARPPGQYTENLTRADGREFLVHIIVSCGEPPSGEDPGGASGSNGLPSVGINPAAAPPPPAAVPGVAAPPLDT